MTACVSVAGFGAMPAGSRDAVRQSLLAQPFSAIRVIKIADSFFIQIKSLCF
jgi:hypothetical protein